MTYHPTVIHRQALLWCNILLVNSILMKKKELKRDEDISGLLYFTVTEGFPMEEDT